MNRVMNNSEQNDIFFWGNNYMSNFFGCKIEENNIIFNCVEQYFMYHKCMLFNSDNIKLIQNILNEKNPVNIKRSGRKVLNYSESIWSDKKYEIMLNGLRLKFNQNEYLKKKLILTNNKNIYEASPYDRIWGIGYSKINALKTDKEKYGLNLLGKALMELRTELIFENQ